MRIRYRRTRHAHWSTQGSPAHHTGRTRTAGIFGPSLPHGTHSSPAGTDPVGLSGTRQQDRGPPVALFSHDSGQVAHAFPETATGWPLRRTATWRTASDQRCPSGGGCGAYFGKQAARGYPLEYAADGQRQRPEPSHDQPDLARLWTSTTS